MFVCLEVFSLGVEAGGVGHSLICLGLVLLSWKSLLMFAEDLMRVLKIKPGLDPHKADTLHAILFTQLQKNFEHSKHDQAYKFH